MPLPSDVLEGSKLKVGWADKKIDEFDEVFRLFFNSKPYRLGRETDPQTLQVIQKATLDKPLPIDLLRLTIECIQHLASALDQMVYALAFRNGVTLDNLGFPFAKNGATHLDTLLKNPNLMAIGPQAVAIVRAAEPYAGGNAMLWSLYRLNNIDKHRHMVPVAVGHMAHIVSHVTIDRVEAGQMVEIGRNVPDQSLATGIEIMRYSANIDSEPEIEYDVVARVVFGDVLAEVNGKEIARVLTDQRNEVAAILNAVEAGCT